MAQRFEEAEDRVFKDIYICRKCNAKNKTQDPENTSCRKCGYPDLRKKNEQFAG
ncbi:MAG: 50S ribosomal protein L40e [Candidatus Nanohaloarchaea archaeon]